ncbi:MAG: hypothetical protein MR724_12205 [Prevotella sp.]|nr:hypothetical protein [Prevotella sp.]
MMKKLLSKWMMCLNRLRNLFNSFVRLLRKAGHNPRHVLIIGVGKDTKNPDEVFCTFPPETYKTEVDRGGDKDMQ